MSTLKKVANVSLILLAMVFLFSSCDKDNELITPDTENERTNVVNSTETANGNFLALMSNDDEENSEDPLEECFTINYPINVNIPGQGEVSVNSEEELWNTIIASFEDLEDPEDFPTMVFPITVTKADGTTQLVADDEELCDLYHECYGELGEGDWDDEDWDEGEWGESCFEFAYPLNLSDGNGNTLTVNSEEDWESVFESNGNFEFFEISFPINVVLADGTTQSIDDEEGLEALYADCYGEDWGDPSDCDSIDIEQLCFEFVYPVDVVLPDGTAISANDEESLFGAMIEFYENNPDATGEPTLGFPLNVTLEDGTASTLNNEDELEELFEECFGDGFGLVNQKVTVGMARMK